MTVKADSKIAIVDVVSPQRNGLSLAEAGDFLRERIVPWDKPYAVERVAEPPPRGRPSPTATLPVGRYDARQVVESMLRRLVKRWLAEGYIEKVGRGTYKLAKEANSDG